MNVCPAYGMEAVGLRFFNIYGSRQALSNPCTGVLAIFASRFLNNKAPPINEDGRQQRDFASVHAITRACRLAMEEPSRRRRSLQYRERPFLQHSEDRAADGAGARARRARAKNHRQISHRRHSPPSARDEQK